jgi:hypothetical protein
MQTRLIFPEEKAESIVSMTFSVGKVGHVTLESNSVLPLLSLACGQKLQLDAHLPSL